MIERKAMHCNAVDPSDLGELGHNLYCECNSIHSCSHREKVAELVFQCEVHVSVENVESSISQ